MLTPTHTHARAHARARTRTHTHITSQVFEPLLTTPGYGGGIHSMTPHAAYEEVSGTSNPHYVDGAKLNALIADDVVFKTT